MQILRKIASILFDRWWLAIVICFIGFALTVIAWLFHSQVLANIAYPLYFAGLAFIGVAAIYYFAYRQVLKAIANIVAGIVAVGAYLVIGTIVWLAQMFQPDHWADNLTIPTDIELHIPKGDRHGYDGLMMENDSSDVADMELYDGFQPGYYNYQLWLNRIEPGKVYLKAFEVTQNIQLSEAGIKRDSEMAVANASDTLTKFAPQRDFTIYEGDWEKFYAARFEVWFVPLDPTKPERKLMEKIYKVEGWMH